MAIFKAISSLLGAVVSPVAKVFQAKEARKQAAESATAKLARARQDSGYKLDMKDSEWEALSKHNEAGSWKDEYVTVIVTSPFVLLFIAAMVTGYTGNQAYLDSVNLGIKSIQDLGVDMGELMRIVVLAAVSIKGIGLLKR